MKRELCVICSNSKGRLVCKIKDNSLICPVCCAKTRTTNCEGCNYYFQAEKHAQEKSSSQKFKEFIMAVDPEINEKVDQALAMVEKGEIQKGESIISALFVKHSHIDMVHFGMGVICLIKNLYDKAIPYFDKAIELNPYFVEAWFNKGAAHQKMLELLHMIQAYRKVIELGDYSEDYVIHAKNFLNDFESKIRKSSGLSLDEYLESVEIFNKAFSAMENKEWKKAILGFKKVLLMDPRHTQSYGNLGLCYGHLGKKKEAIAALDKALELDPRYKPAIINREAISSLSEGEKLTVSRFKSVNYYKDSFIKKKSLVDKF